MNRFVFGLLAAVALLGLSIGAALLLLSDRNGGEHEAVAANQPAKAAVVRHRTPARAQAAGPPPALVPAEKIQPLPEPGPAATPVEIKLRKPPKAGILFDVNTGAVLWSHNSDVELPIASLTKMMTGLLIAERHSPDETVKISAKASKVPGSRIGLLKKGKKVPLGPLLDGLMMVSGNDAAVALAEHDAGSAPAFVKEMNERAQQLGLDCTHFTTPNGLRDHGNYSCADDLEILAQLDLEDPVLSKIVSRHDMAPAFPTRGGKLHLTSNNPFILKRIPGVTGLKTGYTSRAGRCYVITQRYQGRELGVVLLNSPDPLHQVPQLLAAGFAAGAGN